jgi:hypothetical protein
MRQLAGAEIFELQDGNQRGVRAIRIWNAAGLDFTVLAERGMSIGSAAIGGVPLAYASAMGAVHPAYLEDRPLGWLRTWPGGFLTTCGLTQVGSPCVDKDEQLGIHGRAAHLPATNLSWGGEWKEQEYIVSVQGMIRETVAFGEHLTMKRRIWLNLTDAKLWIEDRIENLGFQPVPHMFLQHFNFGFPLVDAAARLELPACKTTPRDAAALPGLDSFMEFQPPTAGYHEQVFYHENLVPGINGQAEVRLTNPTFNGGQGLTCSLRFDPRQYPYLVEWKMMGDGMYVLGLEPANCHVEGRVRERELGTLQVLEPGEVKQYHLEIEFSSR